MLRPKRRNRTSSFPSTKTNYPARVFRDLLSTWHYDTTSERIESLAAELSSEVTTAKASLCVGLIEKEALTSLFGLTYLLDSYGLILRQRYREQKDSIFVYIDKKQDAKSEFAGNSVSEKHVEPIYQLARAA